MIATLRRAFNSRALTTTTPDQQSCDYHQTMQLSEFTLTTTAVIIIKGKNESLFNCEFCENILGQGNDCKNIRWLLGVAVGDKRGITVVYLLRYFTSR